MNFLLGFFIVVQQELSESQSFSAILQTKCITIIVQCASNSHSYYKAKDWTQPHSNTQAWKPATMGGSYHKDRHPITPPRALQAAKFRCVGTNVTCNLMGENKYDLYIQVEGANLNCSFQLQDMTDMLACGLSNVRSPKPLSLIAYGELK